MLNRYTPKHEKKNRYRSRNDIIADILKAALEGTGRTRLMYDAYLSFKQFTGGYLPLVISNGLLEYDRKTKTYTTTIKGRDYLAEYEKLKF